jgi:aminoglycoside phosphotransferase (APT) family kinase protein
MSEHNTGTPWRRSPEEVVAGLTAWVVNTFGADTEVVDAHAPDNGMSSETLLFSVRRADHVERYVARLAPQAEVFPVFATYDLELQKRCMDIIAEKTNLPVPSVPYYEANTVWLGVPFLVMDRIDGITPPDMPPYVFGSWLMELPAEEQAEFQRNAVAVLAELHTITPANTDLAFLARPDLAATPLAQQIAFQRWYYEWAREGEHYPLIERTFAWLDAHMPPESPAVLNWGDSRIGNMLWQGTRPVAVLDWEMATVGPPEVDLSWMIFLHRFFQNLAVRYGFPGMPDFMERSEMIATYEAMSGHIVQNLDWFEVFSALRFAIVSVRTSARGIAYGTAEKPADPDDLIMFRDLLEMMLDGSYWSPPPSA